jgi:copper chaperone NosL
MEYWQIRNTIYWGMQIPQCFKGKIIMKHNSRLLIGVASLFLILIFFFPIWSIDLLAPQYPEGIGLKIWINQITGLKPNDLNNINGLNHYIGMKAIVPDSIPELTIMPYIIIFMVIFGIGNAFWGKRKLVYLWIALFIILGAIGMYDFYIWGYDYGHNLNPSAAIKVPGMSYQPPLIGSKKLLNFTAVSLPAFGSYVLGVSVLLTTAALYFDSKRGSAK